MYLKTIEVQGFKSFANRIVFQFHSGITAIVGPNGSGKSNVADAVRWVLGEQRVKQLRGDSMQDVIFAGTENRRPLGFAAVSITLDNSDHQLPISYEEVTVSRRLYRSGESEYMLNGTQCRLKDINELFYDTGIGKEGYSIIGQGQIDQILSGKPEDRRELFDEAAGIVKFKRRKLAAQKKLADEEQNLERLNDILGELTRQLGPLKEQAETARVYLSKREELKTYEVNIFLAEFLSSKEAIENLEQTLADSSAQLEKVRADLDTARKEYEVVEGELERIGQDLTALQETITQARVQTQQLEGEIALLNEQIRAEQNRQTQVNDRLAALQQELANREAEKTKITDRQMEVAQSLEDLSRGNIEAEHTHLLLQEEITACNEAIEEGKRQIITLLSERSSIQINRQRFDLLKQQASLQRSQITQQILSLKAEREELDFQIKELTEDYETIQGNIETLSAQSDSSSGELANVQEALNAENRQFNEAQEAYHKDASRLETLNNLAERYDGYGNSIRRVMERKGSEPGLLGVVADLLTTDKEYELAVETALGGSIQNIVTEDEETAKRMIAFLKEKKYGRATFLPLSAIRPAGAFAKEEALSEPGVIGLASGLVSADTKYERLILHLLGRTVVTESIDQAVSLARKYQYSLRIVTLEGELLNPGGSITGGAFKNNSNLLGRRREIEELTKQVADREITVNDLRAAIEKQRKVRDDLRSRIEGIKDLLQEANVSFTATKLKLTEAKEKQSSAADKVKELISEDEKIGKELENLDEESAQADAELAESQKKEEELSAKESKKREELEELTNKESESAAKLEQAHLDLAALKQEDEYLAQNLSRLNKEKETMEEEQRQRHSEIDEILARIEEKREALKENEEKVTAQKTEENKARAQAQALTEQREEKTAIQKTFFQRNQELSDQSALLDKECFRLTNQKEKLEVERDAQISYMWDEYELTYSAALELQKPDLGTPAQMKKAVSRLKNEIKGLGAVNVNAIEDYRELSERHDFLSAQQEDLVKSRQALEQIIQELDEGMRKQFKEQFARIQEEFGKSFKQLFGGGKGSLELVEDEDLLEAGIYINAQPPGKKLQNMMQLSGGEKSLTAIALLFAIQNLKPSPFCLLDEIEAALDENNVERFANYLHQLTAHTQFIVITHRRGTMTAADRLYGITMQEKGVSALVSVNLVESELT